MTIRVEKGVEKGNELEESKEKSVLQKIHKIMSPNLCHFVHTGILWQNSQFPSGHAGSCSAALVPHCVLLKVDTQHGEYVPALAMRSAQTKPLYMLSIFCFSQGASEMWLREQTQNKCKRKHLNSSLDGYE